MSERALYNQVDNIEYVSNRKEFKEFTQYNSMLSLGQEEQIVIDSEFLLIYHFTHLGPEYHKIYIGAYCLS